MYHRLSQILLHYFHFTKSNHTILFVFVALLLFHTLTLIYILKSKLFIMWWVYICNVIIRLDPILSSCMIIRNIHTCILHKFLNLFKFSSWNYSLVLLSLAKTYLMYSSVLCAALHYIKFNFLNPTWICLVVLVRDLRVRVRSFLRSQVWFSLVPIWVTNLASSKKKINFFYVVFYICILTAISSVFMFELTLSSEKSWWRRHFVKLQSVGLCQDHSGSLWFCQFYC
jgi:hypothetical protein